MVNREDKIIKTKPSSPIDINGLGFMEVIDDNTGELLLDSVVIGDGYGTIDCLFITLQCNIS